MGGLMVGFMASMPPGPVLVLNLQRNLSKGFRSGIISGMGAATGDTLFSSIAFFSLAFVTAFIENNEMLFKAIGGIVLSVVGISIFLKNPMVQLRRNRATRSSGFQDYISAFGMVISNPTYILVHITLIATVASLGLTAPDASVWSNSLMLVGVFCGALGWWTIVATLLRMVKGHFRLRHMLWLNRICGALITIVGLSLIISSISSLHIELELFSAI